jgi:hypothetical protein
MRAITCILALLAVVVIIYGIGSIYGGYVSSKTATGNTFTAYSSTFWTQTTKADFDSSGYSSNINTAEVDGDAVLSKLGNGNYRATGNLRSQVNDTGIANAKLDLLWWDSTCPAGTTITFSIRAQNTKFTAGAGSPSWIDLTGSSPISAGLPTGRYVQWRAYLTSSSGSLTPALHEVQVWYH